MAVAVTPPGKARIVLCPECRGIEGRACRECKGAGRMLRRACPRCGDTAWDYVNGRDDRQGMTCRISCGYRWTAEDPDWLAQVLPGKVA